MALGVAIVVLTCGEARADSLRDAVQLAVRTHPTVLAAKQLKRAADAGVRGARAGYFPTVDARLSNGWARTSNSSTRARSTRSPDSPQSVVLNRTESSLNIAQVLFDGFDTLSRERAALSRMGAAEFQVFDAGELIGLRAVTAYPDMVRGRGLVELAENNVSRHDDVVNQIRVQVDAGGGSRSDLDQAEGRLSLATATLVQFIGALQTAGAAFLEAVGAVPGELVRPVVSDSELPTIRKRLSPRLWPTIRACKRRGTTLSRASRTCGQRGLRSCQA